MIEVTNNIPTIFVAFGATGDLMRRKVIPSLFYLYEKDQLPAMFRVIGFSRRNLTDESFRAFVEQMLEAHRGEPLTGDARAFLELFQFQRGDFDEAASYLETKKRFDALDAKWKVCANKLFYLAVAPEFYDPIFKHLSDSGLTDPCSPEEGWSRVMVEKPFGVDEETAKQLDLALGTYFKEEQVYRIDHYLAKEMLQNILTFRFANNLFENTWGNQLVERIDIKLLENIGVEKRGAFYDPIGAFRDVGQNHFLQMLALITMRHPESFNASVIQERRAEILEKLPRMSDAQVRSATLRAQYDGYRSIDGVAPDSNTETFFAVQTEIDDPKWKGVPVTLLGGKRLGVAHKEMVITLRHPMPCLCPPGDHHKNVIIIRLEPKEEILIEFWSKKPGFGMETEPRMFHFLLREPAARVQYVEEYARLLLDCVRGDQALFVSTREVQAMWRFADPILAAWKKGVTELRSYAPDTQDILRRVSDLTYKA